MADDSPAKVWSDQRDLPIYLGDSGDGFRLPGKENWRAPDAIAALVGLSVTAILVTVNLDGGNALSILVIGVVVTVAAVIVLSKLPATRPSLSTRLNWFLADLRPQVSCSHPGPAADKADRR
jgi:xanthine/uracil/vitamin C permease (AzgA family)